MVITHSIVLPVHPESYPLVEKILADIKKDVKSVIGDSSALKGVSPAKYADEKFGVPTITDILKELEKPVATRALNSRQRLSKMASKRSKICVQT